MAIFTPKYIFKSVKAITPEFLNSIGIKALILDIDNTLTSHGSQELPEFVDNWLNIMRENGIKLTISSNNIEERVKPFAEKIGLQYVAFSCKPSFHGLHKARKRMNVSKKEVALVGDQIFTDVMGANLYNIMSIMVLPMKKDVHKSILLKRKLEKPFINNYYKKGGKLYE